MPSVLTVAEARGFIPSSPLGDPSLQLAIDDIEEEIVDRFGPYYPGPATIFVPDPSETGSIVLPRRAESITEIVETLAYAGSPVPTRTLDAADYRLRSRRILDRLATGPTPAVGWSRWGVSITFVPVDDTNRRKMVTVDVLKEELAHSGFASLRLGDYSESRAQGGPAESVSASRAKILRRLGSFVLR